MQDSILVKQLQLHNNLTFSNYNHTFCQSETTKSQKRSLKSN